MHRNKSLEHITTRSTRRAFTLGLLGAPLLAATRRPLFNGRDTAGWQQAGNGIWTVENGEIAGRFDPAKPGPGYLLTKEQFTDFDLTADFWISKGGNSGIYIREPQRAWTGRGDGRPGFGEHGGYEVQIDYNDLKNFTGALYNISPATTHAGAEEQWTTMRIACEGPRVRVWVAGTQVNDFSPSRSTGGVIGLQIHGGTPHDHVVRFRKIEIQLLGHS